MADEINVGKDTVRPIFTEHLGKWKISSKVCATLLDWWRKTVKDQSL